MAKAHTIKVRQDKVRKILLEQLRRLPIRELAYEKVGVSRMTCSRWRKTSKKFSREMDAAIDEGREFINGLAESQVINLIRQGKLEAARLWLKHNSPRYTNRLELSGTVNTKDEPLTDTQKKLVRQALKLSSLRNHGQEKQQKKTTGEDPEGQEG